MARQVNNEVTVETHSKEILVFRGKRVTRGQDAWFYLRTVGASYNSNWVADPLEAKDYSDETASTIVKSLETVNKSSESTEPVQLVRMKITTHITVVDLNEGEILEERRKQALAKLNPMEVEALGVQRLATYNKVKNHGT